LVEVFIGTWVLFSACPPVWPGGRTGSPQDHQVKVTGVYVVMAGGRRPGWKSIVLKFWPVPGGQSFSVSLILEGYPKLSLKKYKPIAARNDDANVSRGLL
jgi:hypothetical protein